MGTETARGPPGEIQVQNQGGIRLKEIKTKPEVIRPKERGNAARAPKTAMHRVWLQAKEKLAAESREAAAPASQEESGNTPAGSAEEQLQSAVGTAAERIAHGFSGEVRKRLPVHGTKETVGPLYQAGGQERTGTQSPSQICERGRDLARTKSSDRREENRMRTKEIRARKAEEHVNTVRTQTVVKHTSFSPPSRRQIKQKTPAASSVKEKPRESLRTVKTGTMQTAVHHTQRAAAKTHELQNVRKKAARSAQRTRQAARAAARTVRSAARAVSAGLRAAVAAAKGLAAALIAGGWAAVLVIVLICLIAFIAGSCYGLFLGAEDTGKGTSITQAVSLLNGEFEDRMEEIAESVEHDRQEVTANDGNTAICWEEVLAVFSARTTGAENGTQVVALDAAQIDALRAILWDMNSLSHSTRTETKTVEVTDTDMNGNTVTRTETVTETVLEIQITHRTAQEMASAYSFTDHQQEYLQLMLNPANASLWGQLLGGLTAGGGIMQPDTGWEGTGIFQWPLPQEYPITSPFGWRTDPLTGEASYHGGTDIAAPGGTPILAAADGIVTVANSTDSWGGSYGYHVKLDHGNGQETLYAHCSSICVTVGQKVVQGEVIGYVGTTGASTGNHLHFEVRVGEERVDAMGWFERRKVDSLS